jgi:thermostable 8-oxoguanine DNA glycosylase
MGTSQNKEARCALQVIVPIVKSLLRSSEVRTFLSNRKREGRQLLRRSDFLWREILVSLGTWGGSRGAKNLDIDALGYERLSKLDRVRQRHLVSWKLKSAGVRYATKKTGYLLHNYDSIRRMGGPATAKQAVLDAAGQEGKMGALREYKGIGEKYAHNIMMDAYHPEFHDSIAVDQRIKNISKKLGLSVRTYAEYVAFYQEAASKVGIQPWEMDRLLYKFNKVILACLEEGSYPTRDQVREALALPARTKN